MARRPILYFEGHNQPICEYLFAKKGQAVKIDDLEVGQVIDVKQGDDKRIGLVIEWHESIDVVTQL